MDQVLKKHLRKLTWYTWGSFLSFLLCFLFGFFFLVFIFADLMAAFCVILLFLPFLILLLIIQKKSRTYRNHSFSPVCFALSHPYSCEDVLQEFSTSAGDKYSLQCSEDAYFFKLGRNPVIRTLVLRMTDFDSKKFKQMKSNANQKVTRTYPEAPWTGPAGVRRYPQRIYLNVIYTEEMAGDLQELLNKNAADFPGSLNVVFCPNRIYLPPLFPPAHGMMSLFDLSAYKTAIIIFRALFPIS